MLNLHLFEGDIKNLNGQELKQIKSIIDYEYNNRKAKILREASEKLSKALEEFFEAGGDVRLYVDSDVVEDFDEVDVNANTGVLHIVTDHYHPSEIYGGYHKCKCEE